MHPTEKKINKHEYIYQLMPVSIAGKQDKREKTEKLKEKQTEWGMMPSLKKGYWLLPVLEGVDSTITGWWEKWKHPIGWLKKKW